MELGLHGEKVVETINGGRVLAECFVDGTGNGVVTLEVPPDPDHDDIFGTTLTQLPNSLMAEAGVTAETAEEVDDYKMIDFENALRQRCQLGRRDNVVSCVGTGAETAATDSGRTCFDGVVATTNKDDTDRGFAPRLHQIKRCGL